MASSHSWPQVLQGFISNMPRVFPLRAKSYIWLRSFQDKRGCQLPIEEERRIRETMVCGLQGWMARWRGGGGGGLVESKWAKG
jgi:hypothetical protein